MSFMRNPLIISVNNDGTVSTNNTVLTANAITNKINNISTTISANISTVSSNLNNLITSINNICNEITTSGIRMVTYPNTDIAWSNALTSTMTSDAFLVFKAVVDDDQKFQLSANSTVLLNFTATGDRPNTAYLGIPVTKGTIITVNCTGYMYCKELPYKTIPSNSSTNTLTLSNTTTTNQNTSISELITKVESDPNCNATSALLDAAAITAKGAIAYNSLHNNIFTLGSAVTSEINKLNSHINDINNGYVKFADYTKVASTIVSTQSGTSTVVFDITLGNDASHTQSSTICCVDNYMMIASGFASDGKYSLDINGVNFINFTGGADKRDHVFLALPVNKNDNIHISKTGSGTRIGIKLYNFNSVVLSSSTN